MSDIQKKYLANKCSNGTIEFEDNKIIVISEIASIENCGTKSKISGHDFDLYTYNISLKNGHVIKNILCLSNPRELFHFIFSCGNLKNQVDIEDLKPFPQPDTHNYGGS